MFCVPRLRFDARIATASLLAGILLAAPSAIAQSADTAGLEIYVHDASGAAMPGAKVHIDQQDTHVTRDGVTNKSGEYRFTDIPVGDYVLTIEKEGFAQIVESGITLAISQSPTLNVSMQVASTNTQVNVSGEVPIIDTDRSTIGQTISNVEIENLPSDGRNFTDFALTVPGVSAQETSGQGSGLSFNGQRGRSNSILVDGVENNGQLNGTVRQTLPLDAISQFQVMTSQFLPEFGNAGGGIINVITKSGSDKYHGDAYYFARNSAMDATPYCFGGTNCQLTSLVQNDAGATLGGPLYKDKTYFFASGEYTGSNNFTSNLIAPGDVAAINTVLAGLTTHPFVGSNVKFITAGLVPTSTAQTLASFRMDHTFNEKNTLTFRFLYGHYIHGNPTLDRNDGGLSDVSNYGYDKLQAFSFLGYYTHIFTPSLLNEFHFQYSPQHLIQVPNDPNGPTAVITGTAEFGRNTGFPTLLDESHYEWIDALSKTKGTHLFKVGADILFLHTYTTYTANQGGVFSFGSTASFTAGTPFQFIQVFGIPAIHEPDTITSYYAQDAWKMKPRFTLNYGVRYDIDFQPQGYNQNLSDPIQAPLPKGIPRDYNNIAPRIGFAWALDKKGNTVMRGGYGLFYDKLFLIVARDTLLPRASLTMTTTSNLIAGGAPNTTAQLNAQYAAGPYTNTTVYPTSGAFGPTPPAPSINSIGKSVPIPYAQQANLVLDQALGSNWAVELGYIYVSGEHLIKATNTNLPPPVILSATQAANAQQIGRPYFSSVRINPAFRNITQYGSWGHSRYNGFTGSIIHRTSNNLTLRTSWTWAKEIDDASDFTTAQEPDNPYFPQAEKALGSEDQRNRFVGSAVYRIPYRISTGHHNSIARWTLGSWNVSTISIVGSGSPKNITTGSDSNGDNLDNDRPYVNGLNGLNGGSVIGRNAFRGARSQNVSLRLQKEIPFARGRRVQLSAEAFNLFNHANFSTAYTTWGTAATPNGYTGTPLVWGKPYNVNAGSSETSKTFGAYTAVQAARHIQLGMKIYF